MPCWIEDDTLNPKPIRPVPGKVSRVELTAVGGFIERTGRWDSTADLSILGVASYYDYKDADGKITKDIAWYVMSLFKAARHD